MLGYFDKKAFAALLVKAIGKPRTLNQYGRDCDISGSYISRLTRELVPKAPSAEIIKKLASHAANGVSYYQFMEAAGHISAHDAEKFIAEEKIQAETIKDLVVRDTIGGRVKKITDLPVGDVTEQLQQLGVELISLPYNTRITKAELEAVLHTVKKILDKSGA